MMIGYLDPTLMKQTLAQRRLGLVPRPRGRFINFIEQPSGLSAKRWLKQRRATRTLAKRVLEGHAKDFQLAQDLAETLKPVAWRSASRGAEL